MSRILVDSLVVSDEPGFACSKSKLVESGVRHLRPFNISDDGQLDLSEVYQVPECEAPAGKIRLEAGDILFNNTNSAELVGKAALVPSSMDAGFSNHLTRIRLDSNCIEPAYFAFWLRRLRGQRFFTEQATQWVSQAAYKTSELRKVEINLPDLPEQRLIVDLLSRAEGIVRLRQEAEKKAAEIIPALFLDMFGDPATNSKGWAVAKFGDVGVLDRGKSRHRPRDAAELYGGPYPFIQTGDVAKSGGRITLHTTTYSEAGLAQSKLWKAGTLCITIAANIAKTGVLTFDACFPDSVVGFLPGREVRTNYVQAWLGFLQPTLEATAPQAAQKNINLEILRNLPMIVPPLDFQIEFENRCESIFGIQAQQLTATTKAKAAFDALLSSTFLR